ncbi:hypothetical protein A3F06_02835 [candidate division TM6 bacterium RIFCSPHIGHO2_12_FULL_36_22]|nr:MAG: hypothetical protein A3F06_02835 [candidate division TM6 bacterium RIFCSPHIGHO2_12_FULL_36_22]
MRKTGKYKQIGGIRYFIPDSLPPKDPPFSLSSEATELYGDAMHYLGVLNEMTNRIPDMWRFIKAYVIKEALLSSEIEGINTTLMNVFTQPLLKTEPDKNTQLVMNYTKALELAVKMIQQEDMPIVSRMLLAAHSELMAGEGDKSDPGNYRKQSVRVGQFVPPPALDIPQLMADLERFINTNESLPLLVRAGLAHVQFETIHPFLDGNGRIGRLLIILMLLEGRLLSEPLLYISYYFKKYHLEYYQHLNRAHTEGDFENWIIFFLKAVKESSMDAYKRADAIEQLEQELIKKIINSESSEKLCNARLEVLSLLFSMPVISINEVATQLDVAYNTAHKIITDLVNLNILKQEDEQQKRGKLFKFQRYIEILEQDFD